MNLTIYEKLISVSGKFYIKDDNGSTLFYVSRNFLSRDSHFISFRDINGMEAAFIKRKYFWKFWKMEYEVYLNNKNYATVSCNEKTLGFNNTFTISGNYPYTLEARTYGFHNVTFLKGGVLIAEAKPKIFIFFGHLAYKVTITDDSNYLIILALLMVILNILTRDGLPSGA